VDTKWTLVKIIISGILKFSVSNKWHFYGPWWW